MNAALFFSQSDLGSLPQPAVELAIDIAAEQQAHAIACALAQAHVEQVTLKAEIKKLEVNPNAGVVQAYPKGRWS